MSETTSRSLQVLIIADPGQPSRRISAIRTTFEQQLQHAFTTTARVDSCTETLRIQPDHQLEMTTLDAIVKKCPHADLVLMLTAMPRHTHGTPLVAEVLAERNIAVISYPTLGAGTTKRSLLRILMSCTNQLLPFASTVQARPFMPRWGQWSFKGDSGHQTLHTHALVGGLRLVTGMTMANEPLRMAPKKLSSALAAATATGAFGIFYNSIWQMSNHLSTVRLISIGIGAVFLMVAWLIISQRLWDTPVNERLAPVVLYFNLSTVLTLLIAVACLYAVLVVGILIGGLVVIDPGFMSEKLQTKASFTKGLMQG